MAEASPEFEDMIDKYEDFITVGKNVKKRPRLNSTFTQDQPNQKFQVLITPIDIEKSLTKVNPIHVTRDIHNGIGKPIIITKKGRSLLIECSNIRQSNALRNVTEVASIQIKTSEWVPFSKTKGAIVGIPLDVTDEELLIELKTQGVIHVCRIMKRVKGNLTGTTAFCLSFDSDHLLAQVSIGYMLKRVSIYVLPVRRCTKCQGFGHIQDNCKYSLRCVRCGESHTPDKCPSVDSPSCFRCNGKHSAAYQGCPLYKRAKQIQSVQFTEKITFVEARKKISYAEATKKKAHSNDQPNGSKIHAINQNIPKPSTNQPEVIEIPDIPIPTATFPSIPLTENITSKETSIRKVDKTKKVEKKHTESEPAQNINELIAFLVFVINNLEGNNTKSNIIKLVVEAANKCFGFKARAEFIHEMLNKDT